MTPRAISYDTETTGLSPHTGDEMFSYSTCTPEAKIVVQRLDGPRSRRAQGSQRLDRLWRSTRDAKVMHNAKFDLTFTQDALGRNLEEHRGHIHDTSIMSHILQNLHPNHKLKEVCWELAGYPRDDEAAVKRYTRGGRVDYSAVPEHIMKPYQERDADRTMLLFLFLWPKIQANPQFMDVYKMEMDLVWTTARMERRGVMVSRQKCGALIRELDDKIADLIDRIQEHKPGLNPSSYPQLSGYLFNQLKLPVLVRTDTDGPSTSKEGLLPLRDKHPVIDLIMEYRSYINSQPILQSYLDFANEHGILHPDIHTNGAKTNRESCRRPNLQNVEKEGVLLNPFPVAARKIFRPRPGHDNYHYDYSGIEMRLLIHYSRDPRMLEILGNDEDPHQAAAEIFFGEKFLRALRHDKDLAKTLRNASKNANFAIPYGAAYRKVAATLGLTEAEGKKVFGLYQGMFPGLCELNHNVAADVLDCGYVETILGRRLYAPRSKPYVGTNFLIQGTAAEILKRAQVRLDAYLREATSDEVRLILPIHDELVIEYPRKRKRDRDEILQGIRERMIDFPMFDVPLEVSCKRSVVDWASAKEIEIAA